tara:strand:+ start:23 stop:427 length:405 start_codon:yes stop_codon:yes gene_type:complete
MGMKYSETETHALKVNITGYNSNKGQIALALYNDKNQYTDNPWKHFELSKSSAIKGVVSFSISDLPPGKYAISFLDDENSNNEMDYAFWGYPLEGFGFSNDSKPGFLSAPKYEKCVFKVDKDKELTLNAQYWNK